MTRKDNQGLCKCCMAPEKRGYSPETGHWWIGALAKVEHLVEAAFNFNVVFRRGFQSEVNFMSECGREGSLLHWDDIPPVRSSCKTWSSPKELAPRAMCRSKSENPMHAEQ